MSVALRRVEPIDELRYALAHKSEVVLRGPAGSGKTTLVNQLENTYLLAPTDRAARRLAEVCKREANTIHSAAFAQPIEHWMKPDGEECLGQVVNGIRQPAPCADCPLACTLAMTWPGKEMKLKRGMTVVVDETSMVNEEMATAIRNRVHELAMDLKILWVGDGAQLKPVKGNPGVDLQNPDVLLETVYRTDRPGILDFSTAIRTALGGVAEGKFPGVSMGTEGQAGAAKWRDRASERMLITYMNRDRIALNAMVRESRKRVGRLAVQDRLLIRENDRRSEVLNGEVHVVTHVDFDPKFPKVARVETVYAGKPFHFAVALELLDTEDQYAFRRQYRALENPWHFTDSFVNVQYGYALTCHAAQGCEADEVGVLWADWQAKPRHDSTPEQSFLDARAWLYTACTRAKQSLTIWRGR